MEAIYIVCIAWIAAAFLALAIGLAVGLIKRFREDPLDYINRDCKKTKTNNLPPYMRGPF